MTVAKPRVLSLELALVVGLPVLTILAGAYAMSLAYTKGFTPLAPPAVTAPHRG